MIFFLTFSENGFAEGLPKVKIKFWIFFNLKKKVISLLQIFHSFVFPFLLPFKRFSSLSVVFPMSYIKLRITV